MPHPSASAGPIGLAAANNAGIMVLPFNGFQIVKMHYVKTLMRSLVHYCGCPKLYKIHCICQENALHI